MEERLKEFIETILNPNSNVNIAIIGSNENNRLDFINLIKSKLDKSETLIFNEVITIKDILNLEKEILKGNRVIFGMQANTCSEFLNDFVFALRTNEANKNKNLSNYVNIVINICNKKDEISFIDISEIVPNEKDLRGELKTIFHDDSYFSISEDKPNYKQLNFISDNLKSKIIQQEI